MDTFVIINFVFFLIVVFVLIILFVAITRGIFTKEIPEEKLSPKAKRLRKNPIISPFMKHSWSHGGTFNPAAIKDKNGKFHIIYRAVGSDGVSRLAYSASKNGQKFDEHEEYPVFSMQNLSKSLDSDQVVTRPDPVMYPSGGSWGGCEDPRMVNIDGRIYVTFSAFDSWDYLRMGLISIREEDFYNKKWRWNRPLLISPKGRINKNWVIFPEKFNGKFAILHSISPEIKIDYVNSFEELADGRVIIDSKFNNRFSRTQWDTWVRGAGPPPLKTDKGWLVLYHAVEKKDPDKYKLGAMLLDLKDPNKIIARAPAPILNPDKWYENDWKPGIIYVCGAVIEKDKLFIYYGGGDKHVCVAQMQVNELLNWLLTEGRVLSKGMSISK